MESLTIDYAGGFKFVTQVRGHTIISDQPVDQQGEDLGPTPPEFFAASLGACVGVYAAYFANKHPELSLDGMRIDVAWEKAPEPPSRIGTIQIKVILPAGVPERLREPLYRSMASCLIHSTLTHVPQIELVLEGQATS